MRIIRAIIIIFPAVFLIISLSISADSPILQKKNDNIYGAGRQKGELNIDFPVILDNLKKTVNTLAVDIGARGYLHLDSLQKTIDYISSEFKRYGYDISYQPYEYQGNTYKNIYVEIKGSKTPEKVLIVGAHYDTVSESPGADDNASGIAGLLELSRLLQGSTLDITVRFVAFTLEEPPLFRSNKMGSYVYAESLGQGIEGMICLEMIGYFTDKPDSQNFPLSFLRWFYPDKGNFIALVSNFQSKSLVNRVKKGFKKGSDLPVETISTFSAVPGIDFSDHRSFWKFGHRAIMVTDTAFYRNPYYHGIMDLPENLDFKRMTEVVLGLRSSIEGIAGSY